MHNILLFPATRAMYDYHFPIGIYLDILRSEKCSFLLNFIHFSLLQFAYFGTQHDRGLHLVAPVPLVSNRLLLLGFYFIKLPNCVFDLINLFFPFIHKSPISPLTSPFLVPQIDSKAQTRP